MGRKSKGSIKTNNTCQTNISKAKKTFKTARGISYLHWDICDSG